MKHIQAPNLLGSVKFAMVRSIVVTNLYHVVDVRDGATFVSLAIAVNWHQLSFGLPISTIISVVASFPQQTENRTFCLVLQS